MQQNPKDFDPKKLKIQIECPQPENIAAGIGFHIKNEQSVIQPPVQNISQPIQGIQKEPFQITGAPRRSYFYFFQTISQH